MPLNHDAHELLLILERAQGSSQEWVHIDALRHLSEKEIERAVRENWVKQKSFGNNREFKILAAGYSALGDNAELAIKRMRGENIDVLDAPGESLGTDEPAKAVRTRHVVSVETCVEDGCGEPCYSTPARKYNRCKSHQQAIWRNRENAKRNAGKTQPHIAIVEPPVADDDTQPDMEPVVVNTPPVSAPALTRLVARAAVKFLLIAKGG